ncbi:MAG: ABC transporter permease [Actinobacteria bacterium]|nr:ABC transporter permease [Actinomycetota bacterium]
MHFLAQVVEWFTTASHWHGAGGVPQRLLEHVALSASAMAVAIAVALPVGMTLGHVRRGGVFAINVANIGRALPSLGLLVLAASAMHSISSGPARVALIALAIPPILTNTFIGVRDVDADIREAARGMGLSGGQVLRRVEAPLALPLIVAGIRTAAVNVVATATLAAIVAGGGLGRYIVDGIAQQDQPQAFAGAFLVAVLSVATELSLGAVQRRVAAPSATVRRRGEEELAHAFKP